MRCRRLSDWHCGLGVDPLFGNLFLFAADCVVLPGSASAGIAHVVVRRIVSQAQFLGQFSAKQSHGQGEQRD